ncbi:carbamoyltransferase [Paenibacillus sambharensis]|uniref:Carbamoyltransferase n=1 Tax=Paenibacillus sambharensis TaxID=1803190 RepID=A0A2W1LDJ9_9BACL|nr:carbamoyltransferase [Paenibacillus sambharensis]
MQDGYYLSAYLHIDPLDYLLETIVRHDQNIALFLKKGSRVRLVRYWEIERWSGEKGHSRSFFSRSQAVSCVNELLAPLSLCIDDMVEIWGTPLLQTADDYHTMDEFPDLSYHSVSHLFSSIMMDTAKFYDEQIIGFAVDGGPDGVVDTAERVGKPYYSGCIVRKGKVTAFPVQSPGLLWGWAMFFFKLREGTLMALASASQSEYYASIDEVPPIYDGSWYFGKENLFEQMYEEINSLEEADAGVRFNGFDPRFTVEENKISMLMKHIQQVSYRIMEQNVEEALRHSGFKPEDTYLSLSGGFTLNCPTNHHLMSKYRFKGFMAPPCVGDSGLSLGMGLYAFHKKMGRERLQFSLEHAYYGGVEDNLDCCLQDAAFAPYILGMEAFDPVRAAGDLASGPIVWFDGASEIGPRALGHRSVLGDPRGTEAKNAINHIKRREWWRPVAPIVLKDHVKDWFVDGYDSPFMLHTFTLKADKAGLVPSVAHLDSTARVQTIARDGGSLSRLIGAFYEKTGVPMICNSSLNDKGEPIINRIVEALHFALTKGIKVAYINGVRVELKGHAGYPADGPYPRPLQLEVTEEERQQAWAGLNPHNVPLQVLQFYRDPITMRFHETYDLTRKEDAERLIKSARSKMRHQSYVMRGSSN